MNRDGHVEVAKAYYSAAAGVSGAAAVWCKRWDSRLVRLFNHRFEQIALHVRQAPGRFSTQPLHIAAEKISGLERGAAYLHEQGRLDWSPGALRQWADAMLTARGIERDAGAARIAGLGQEAAERSPGNSLQKRPFPTGRCRLRTAPQAAGITPEQPGVEQPRNAAAVSRRASDHSAFAGLCPGRQRPGDPSPGRSLVHERRFYEAYLDKKECRFTQDNEKGPAEFAHGKPTGPRGIFLRPGPGIPRQVAPQPRARPLFPRTL